MKRFYATASRESGDVEAWWLTREEAAADVAGIVAAEPARAAALYVLETELPGRQLTWYEDDVAGRRLLPRNQGLDPSTTYTWLLWKRPMTRWERWREYGDERG